MFAPSEDALSLVDDFTLAFLKSDEGREDLVRVLSFHVVPFVLPSDIIREEEVPTLLEGSKIKISFPDGASVLVNGVTVVSSDVLANNGIIHVIDALLIPPAPAPTIQPTFAPSTGSLAPTASHFPSGSPSFMGPSSPAPSQSPSISTSSAPAGQAPIGTLSSPAPSDLASDAPTDSPSDPMEEARSPAPSDLNALSVSPSAPPSNPIGTSDTVAPTLSPSLAPSDGTTSDAPSQTPTVVQTPSPSVFTPTDATTRVSIVEVIAQTFSLQLLEFYLGFSRLTPEISGPGPFTMSEYRLKCSGLEIQHIMFVRIYLTVLT